MPSKNPPTLVAAVQTVFEALEPFDESARQRILASVVSLLGGQPLHSGGAPMGAGGSPPGHPALTAARPIADRPLSPVELVQEKKPATNPQRLAVFAYYREKSEGLTRFAKDDLKAYFPKAKIPLPQNLDRDYGKAVTAGWIYDDGADSYLTSKGLEAVEAGFEGKALPRGTAVAKKARGRKGGRKR